MFKTAALSVVKLLKRLRFSYILRAKACNKRGYSSVGRAPALQAGGHRFESDYLHQIVCYLSVLRT